MNRLQFLRNGFFLLSSVNSTSLSLPKIGRLNAPRVRAKNSSQIQIPVAIVVLNAFFCLVGRLFLSCPFFLLDEKHLHLLFFFETNFCSLYRMFLLCFELLESLELHIRGISPRIFFSRGLEKSKTQRVGMASLGSSRSSIALIVLYSSEAAKVCSSPKDYVRRAKLKFVGKHNPTNDMHVGAGRSRMCPFLYFSGANFTFPIFSDFRWYLF